MQKVAILYKIWFRLKMKWVYVGIPMKKKGKITGIVSKEFLIYRKRVQWRIDKEINPRYNYS
jgi:hypothetical protein